ncbi:MAG: cbb3-type cytochrome c oxidase subunit I [Bacteroidia bacterium]
MKKEIGLFFVFFALLALLGGMLLGCTAAFNFLYPGFFNSIPFIKCRPLHVSLVVAWIFLSATGGIYYYLPRYCGIELYSRKLPKIHLGLFLITGITILTCYLFGKFGGREYWEYPPILAIPVLVTWILFGFNYFKSVIRKAGDFPVYLWMWGTGIFFFLFTFIESNLWVFPYFRNHLVRDITVQWKSYGALVGSWNMLVYGTGIFLMARISKNEAMAKSNLAFGMYGLGLSNLLFGWAHHIYILPNASWIRYTSYVISMSELIFLAKIIWNWKKSMQVRKLYSDQLVYKFIMTSDAWIFINMLLALLISIPAVNIFTHGTHVTVAHAMGSSVGINTMILLASVTFLVTDVTKCEISETEMKRMTLGLRMSSISLFVFFISLVAAGITKGWLTVYSTQTFQELMARISPFLLVFAIAGLGLLTGLILVTGPLLKYCIRYFKSRSEEQEHTEHIPGTSG